MASREECDRFTEGFTERFDALISWTTENWPEKNQPLDAADFSTWRREVALLLGARLHAHAPAEAAPAPADGGAQYINSAPAPWP